MEKIGTGRKVELLKMASPWQNLVFFLLFSLYICYGYKRINIMMKTKLKEEGTGASPYNIIKNLNYNFPSIIIVNPFDEANLGTISRGMMNFGFTDLRIVNPGTHLLTKSY